MDKDSVEAINGVPQAQVLDEVKGLNYLSNHSETDSRIQIGKQVWEYVRHALFKKTVKRQNKHP